MSLILVILWTCNLKCCFILNLGFLFSLGMNMEIWQMVLSNFFGYDIGIFSDLPDLLNVDSVILSVSFDAKFWHCFGSLDMGFFCSKDKTLKLFYHYYFKVYQ
ncbi:hypothetical protein C1646_749968 [Rhizophagus diaphanus]|nr:hypothetical protein C1646_749968 [Rhizophagus diaphanus] [Rhizophagus sp. MUCL 43196]